MYSDDGRSNLKNSRSSRWAYIPRVRSARKIGTGSRRRDGTGSSRSWNDNKGTACPRGAIMRRTTDLSGAPARCPAKVSHPLRGMALGTLAEIAVRLVISGYIFAVVVYVNASGNWDKDDDLGTWILWHEQSRPTNPCPTCQNLTLFILPPVDYVSKFFRPCVSKEFQWVIIFLIRSNCQHYVFLLGRLELQKFC